MTTLSAGDRVRYRALFEHAAHMVLLFDLEGNLLDANPAMARLIGYGVEEVQGRGYVERVIPGDASRFASRIDRLKAGEPEVFDTVLRHKDGRDVLVSVSLLPVAVAGNVQGFFQVTRDVTEARRREARLRFLERAGAELVSTLDHYASLSSVADLAIEGLADCFTVEMLQNDGQLHLVAIAQKDQRCGTIARWLDERRSGAKAEESLSWDVIRSGKPVVLPGGESEITPKGRRYLEQLGPMGVHSLIAVPFRAQGRTMGAISLFQVRSEYRLGPADLETVGELARLLGLVVDNGIMYEKARWAALHDPLTELPNRMLLTARIQSAFAAAGREAAQSSAVLFLDLDNFKVVNDTLGHCMGDQLIKAVAQRISQCLTPEEIVARFGGDEFVVFLERADLARAKAVARRLLEELDCPFELGSEGVNASASIGIAISSDCHKPEEMLRRADLAMYHAKGVGKDRFAVFDEAMHTAAVKRLQLERDMRQALKRREFMLEYQPVVDLRSGRTVALEALVRWSHPARGFLMPGEFIKLAEDTGLIVELGKWVLRQACIQLRQWQDHFGRADLVMSVNLSPRQFQDPELVGFVAQVLAETRLNPSRLQLEITESMLVQDDTHSDQIVRSLQELGVRLALDDFGTGYSALNYLKRFPLHTVKIDRSFIGDLGTANRDVAIVRGVLTVAKELGMKVTAEGVETRTQAERLRLMGCDCAQGFYFAEPLVAAEAEALLLAAGSGQLSHGIGR